MSDRATTPADSAAVRHAQHAERQRVRQQQLDVIAAIESLGLHHPAEATAPSTSSPSPNPIGSSSNPAPSPQSSISPNLPAETLECEICFNPSPKTAVLPSGERWCEDCINFGLEEAIRDHTAWPIMYNSLSENAALPKMSPLVPPDLYRRYTELSLEMTTKHRTYCCNMRCSALIVPRSIAADNRATCQTCQQETCALCKAAFHEPPAVCAPEVSENDALLLETVKEEGWKNCPTCGRYVELVEGCDHITCSCLTEFCYVCGALWGHCTEYEHRLLEERLEREDPELRRFGYGVDRPDDDEDFRGEEDGDYLHNDNGEGLHVDESGHVHDEENSVAQEDENRLLIEYRREAFRNHYGRGWGRGMGRGRGGRGRGATAMMRANY